MIEWNSSILSKVEDKSHCWICGRENLSREHVYKRTDLKQISKNPESGNDDKLGLWKPKSNRLIEIQGLNSKYVKWQPSICEDCNNSKTKPFDLAYDKIIDYFQLNKDRIKKTTFIDFSNISEDWTSLKVDFVKYCVKHVGCRLFDCNIQPTKNMSNFLLGNEDLTDIKFVFQLKSYYFDSLDKRQIYLGPLVPFEQNHLIIGNKMTSVTGWYSFNELSINYLVKMKEFNYSTEATVSKYLKLDAINYSALDNKKFDDILEQTTYDKLLEFLEYFPFTGENQKIDHYNYIKNYNNNR